MPRTKQQKWFVKKCSSFSEMRDVAIQEWQKVSASKRADAAWQMVVDAWALKNKNPDELKFQRTVTVLRKA